MEKHNSTKLLLAITMALIRYLPILVTFFFIPILIIVIASLIGYDWANEIMFYIVTFGVVFLFWFVYMIGMHNVLDIYFNDDDLIVH